jgi:TRAP transporter TAXI family solute receptor
MFTLVSFVMAIISSPCFVFSQGLSKDAFPKNIAIGTASAGGAWYPIGAVIADIISQSSLGVQAITQTTGGGVENCKLVNNGDTELAITLGYLAYNAQNGLDPFPQKMNNISGLFGGLSTGVMQVVVNADSPIKTYQDLKGKKVAVGPAGGGAIITLQAALEAFGIKYSQIKPS